MAHVSSYASPRYNPLPHHPARPDGLSSLRRASGGALPLVVRLLLPEGWGLRPRLRAPLAPGAFGFGCAAHSLEGEEQFLLVMKALFLSRYGMTSSMREKAVVELPGDDAFYEGSAEIADPLAPAFSSVGEGVGVAALGTFRP